MTPFQTKVAGGVMVTLISAGLLWFVPYEIDHHTVTNDAAIKVEQIEQKQIAYNAEFREFMLYAEYKELLQAQRVRQLSPYEQDRLDHIKQLLEQIRKTRYSK